MWFDSHCHIHLCDGSSPEEVLAQATSAGVDRVLTVGIDPASSAAAASLAEDDRVYAAVGVHPNSADAWDDDARAAIEQLLSSSRVVAVGESGLDFYRDYVAREVQERAFRDHIELAKEHERALVIHTRDSLDAALDVLEANGAPARFVFHCWSGDENQLRRSLDLGAYVSFAGNVSFKNAQNLRDAAALVPDERLLIETDSPFLTPVPFRGKPNEPARLPLVGETVAGVRRATPAAIARLTTENAERFFGLG